MYAHAGRNERRHHLYRLVTRDGVFKVGKRQRNPCRVTSADVMTIICEGSREAERAGAPMPHLRRSSAGDDKSRWHGDERCQNTI